MLPRPDPGAGVAVVAWLAAPVADLFRDGDGTVEATLFDAGPDVELRPVAGLRVAFHHAGDTRLLRELYLLTDLWLDAGDGHAADTAGRLLGPTVLRALDDLAAGTGASVPLPREEVGERLPIWRELVLGSAQTGGFCVRDDVFRTDHP